MAQFQFQNDELEFIDEVYGMANIDDELLPFTDSSTPRTYRSGNDDPFDSDFDDDFDFCEGKGMSKNDSTTAVEARNGKDIQGIPWERLNFTREKYRDTRLKQYNNFENLPSSSRPEKEECMQVKKGYTFYDFQCNTRLIKPTIVHFQGFRILLREMWSCEPCQCFEAQLRNLLWATSKHDVYLIQNSSVMHWSAVCKRSKEVLNVAKPIVPSTKCLQSLPQPLSRVKISTMCVKDNLLVAGGFQGELICKYLSQQEVAFTTKITTEENAITNAVDICNSSSGSKWVIAGNNDAHVRVFDAANFVCVNDYCFPWSVNSISATPDGKLMAVVGDSAECLISESHTGKVIGTLKGHSDYSFASAWHPDGRILATGNQDTTCRLWDIRNMSESLEVLKGNMGAIRGLKFSSDGRFMAMAEPADFVHIFDTKSGYDKAQEIDLFGEIAGISFSPDTEAFFVGVADRMYGSVLEFRRRHYNGYLEVIY